MLVFSIVSASLHLASWKIAVYDTDIQDRNLPYLLRRSYSQEKHLDLDRLACNYFLSPTGFAWKLRLRRSIQKFA
jgi:hypothetical protein